MALDNPPEILYEDEDLIAINKPAGFLSIKDGYQPNLPNLKSTLQTMRASIWSVHRLDKCTSGVVLFAKTAQTHRALNSAFENRSVNKHYMAIVHGCPCWQSLALSIPLLKNGDREHRTVYDKEKGKMSRSTILVKRRTERFSLMEILPRTGFTHQIRAQLSIIGFPIMDDDLYYRAMDINRKKLKRPEGSEQIFLHARRISFQHPSTGTGLEIEAPAPPKFQQTMRNLGLWDYY